MTKSIPIGSDHLHQEGISPLAGALERFVHACEGVEAVLVGVVAVQELNAQVIYILNNQAKVSTLEAPLKLLGQCNGLNPALGRHDDNSLSRQVFLDG